MRYIPTYVGRNRTIRILDNVAIAQFPNRVNFQDSYGDDGMELYISKISEISTVGGRERRKLRTTVRVYGGKARGGLSQ